jgi:hypothetical protein
MDSFSALLKSGRTRNPTTGWFPSRLASLLRGQNFIRRSKTIFGRPTVFFLGWFYAAFLEGAIQWNSTLYRAEIRFFPNRIWIFDCELNSVPKEGTSSVVCNSGCYFLKKITGNSYSSG